MSNESTRVRCEHTNRLIATIDTDGIHVWCRREKVSELISWEALDAARLKAQEQEKCREAC